jgi:DNA-binding transcriptional MerR regulator
MQFIKILKDTGMTIKEIKKYSQLQSEGSATMSERMNEYAD